MHEVLSILEKLDNLGFNSNIIAYKMFMGTKIENWDFSELTVKEKKCLYLWITSHTTK